MTTGFKKGDLTIRNKLYGDRTVPAYVKDGVGVSRIGKVWGVYHLSGGVEVYYKLQRPRLEDAKAVAQQVIDLDVDWTLEPGDKWFEEKFRAAVGRIREIAEGTAS
jgi:hypothetical protein